MIYEQFEDLPFRGSMARTSKHERNDNYGSKLSHFFRWLHRFAHSSVGKSFDMAYHYVCKRYPNNIGYISPKDEFKLEVNYYGDPWKSRWYRELYVDAEGVIRDNKPEPRDRFLKVPVLEKKFYYKLKPMTLANEQRLYQWLAINFGRGPAVSVFVTGIIPPSIAGYIFGTDHWRLQYTRNLDEVKSLFEKVGPDDLVFEKVRDLETGKINSLRLSNPENIKGKVFYVKDDLCDGGGTFVGIAKALKELVPDAKLYISVCHMVNPKGIENLSANYDHVWFSNSYKNWENLPENVTQIDVTEWRNPKK